MGRMRTTNSGIYHKYLLRPTHMTKPESPWTSILVFKRSAQKLRDAVYAKYGKTHGHFGAEASRALEQRAAELDRSRGR